jgi:hypothetical protein
MRPAARIASGALGVGVAVGLVVAVAVPGSSADDRPAGPTTTTAPHAASSGGAASPTVLGSRVLRTGPARPEPTTPGALLLRVQGATPVVARLADPGGGPEWAVRVFDAERTYRDDRGVHVIGHNRCSQLGRVYRGRFGWLDGDGTFRPVRPSLFASPTNCGSRRPDVGGHPFAETLRTTTGLSGPSPHLAATVLWGRLGRAASDVRVRFGGASDGVTAGAEHVVLRVGAPGVDATSTAVTARYGGAALRVVRPAGADAVLAVRAADPVGGLPYGLSARRRRGAWCVGPVGRVVDGRVGTLDFRFGTFIAFPGTRVSCGNRTRTGSPVVAEESGGGDLGDDPMYTEGAARPGRIARRAADGTTWTAGLLRDDVRSITLRTPRDVRTLVPSAPAHAYLVVYDGQFPAGSGEKVLRLANGRTVRSPLFLGVY